MRRAEKNGCRRYRGRRPRGGLSAGQVGAVAILTLIAILVMTIHANSQWTGMSAGEQLHQALFVAKDWD